MLRIRFLEVNSKYFYQGLLSCLKIIGILLAASALINMFNNDASNGRLFHLISQWYRELIYPIIDNTVGQIVRWLGYSLDNNGRDLMTLYVIGASSSGRFTVAAHRSEYMKIRDSDVILEFRKYHQRDRWYRTYISILAWPLKFGWSIFHLPVDIYSIVKYYGDDEARYKDKKMSDESRRLLVDRFGPAYDLIVGSRLQLESQLYAELTYIRKFLRELAIIIISVVLASVLNHAGILG